jgi:hypothetical protein
MTGPRVSLVGEGALDLDRETSPARWRGRSSTLPGLAPLPQGEAETRPGPQRMGAAVGEGGPSGVGELPPAWWRRLRSRRSGSGCSPHRQALSPAPVLSEGPGIGVGDAEPVSICVPLPNSPFREDQLRCRPSARGRGLRGLGAGATGRHPRVLRALRAPAPRPGVGRHGRRRRLRHARVPGDGAGERSVRRGHPGHSPGPPGHRPHPRLHHRQLGDRPAGVHDQRRRRGDRGRPQWQPHQHRGAGRGT